jgi:hypothetical protein
MMPEYIEYQLEDGSTILIEVEDKGGRVRQASQKEKGKPIAASKKFNDALSSMRGSMKALLNELDELRVEEAEIRFGIKSIGEAGIGNGLFAIGKVGGEVNYEITLKWKKPQPKAEQ